MLAEEGLGAATFLIFPSSSPSKHPHKAYQSPTQTRSLQPKRYTMRIVSSKPTRSIVIYITHRPNVHETDRRYREDRRQIVVFVQESLVEYFVEPSYHYRNECSFRAYHSYPNKEVKDDDPAAIIITHFVRMVVKGLRLTKTTHNERVYEVREHEEGRTIFTH